VLAGDDRVQFVVADAAEWLAAYSGPPFDLAFVEWRPGKYEHRGRLLAHLAPGALYVCDDLLPQPT
jgi:predicted O-methyltransferase YrrM